MPLKPTIPKHGIVKLVDDLPNHTVRNQAVYTSVGKRAEIIETWRTQYGVEFEHYHIHIFPIIDPKNRL